MGNLYGCGTVNGWSLATKDATFITSELRQDRDNWTQSLSGDTSDPDDKSEERMKPIRKAVFPVAGLGTRFLPATKAMPKEMLPVVDRPLIQHVVDEAREAGIEHF